MAKEAAQPLRPDEGSEQPAQGRVSREGKYIDESAPAGQRKPRQVGERADVAAAVEVGGEPLGPGPEIEEPRPVRRRRGLETGHLVEGARGIGVQGEPRAIGEGDEETRLGAHDG